MPSCTILFGDFGQLLQNAVLSAAATCGNGNLAPTPANIALETASGATVVLPTANVVSGYPSAAGKGAPLPNFAPDTRIAANSNDIGAHHLGGYAFFGAANADSAAPNTASGQPPYEGSPHTEPVYHRFEQPAAEPSADGAEAAEPGGGLILNGGYSSIEGISAGVKINRTNIVGPGTELKAGARFSKVRTLYELGFSDRTFLDTSLGFSSTVFVDRVAPRNFGKGVKFAPFRQSTRGIDVILNRKFKSGLSATLNYRLSDDLFKIKGKAPVCDAAIFGSSLCGSLGNTTRSVVTAALSYSEKSRSAGTIFDVKLRLVQDISVGGTASFSRTSMAGGVNIVLSSALQLSFDLEGGHIMPINKGKVPLFDRFFIGEASMRGFDLRGIGPKILPTAAAPGQTVGIGGRTYYAARTELSVTMGGPLGIRGLRPGIFIDVGSVFGANRASLLPGEILTGNSPKPRISAGVGLAMKTAAGNFRIDIAKPLVKQQGDRGKMLSISFGAAI